MGDGVGVVQTGPHRDERAPVVTDQREPLVAQLAGEGDDVRAEYLRASRERVPSIVADYRASAGIDLAHDQADRDAGRRLEMPVSVLQQDWGAALGFDAAGIWGRWAQDLVHRTAAAGHFMAEQDPDLVLATVRDLLRR